MNSTDTVTPVATAPVRYTLVQRLGNKISALFAALAVLTFSAPAHASTGLLNGAETGFFTAITDYFTGNLLPLVFLLAAIVVGSGMLLKYVRKAVSS